MRMARPAPEVNVSPAIKLVSIFAVAIVLQSALGLLLGLALSLWAFVSHRVRFLKLLRRVRLLILVLFGVTLFMTSGAAIFPEWGLHPTEEGVALGLAQLVRLIGMLAAVCLLLDTTDDRRLAAGSLALLESLAGKRQWPERAVARLLLVFHYLETSPKPKSLHDVLALAGADLSGGPAQGTPEVLELESVSLSGREKTFCALMLGAAVLSLVWGNLV